MSGALETNRAAKASVASLCPPSPRNSRSGVVLLRSERVALEQLLFHQVQPVVGAPEVEKRFLFERVEAARAVGGWVDGHGHVRHATLREPVCLLAGITVFSSEIFPGIDRLAKP